MTEAELSAIAVEQWQLTQVPCWRAKCARCGHVEHEEGSADRATMRLKFYGWRMVGNAPWCDKCTTWSK